MPPMFAGGQPLAVGVPLLGAGLDGRVQKCRAQARRDAEREEKRARTAARQHGRCKKAAAQQRCAPQPCAARAVLILQKTADHASHAKGRDQDTEGIACPLLAQAVFVHDRLLEHAPRRRDARQHLNGCTCRKDGPGVFCCKLLFHRLPSEWFFPYSVPISIDKTADSFIMKRYYKRIGENIPASAAASPHQPLARQSPLSGYAIFPRPGEVVPRGGSL